MINVAIGDIHGCIDQLKDLWNKILIELSDKRYRNHPKRIIFLGDYIDRGPDSKAVVQFLIDIENNSPVDFRFVFLKGNHEQMMLERMDSFVIHGGFQTLQSYNVSVEQFASDNKFTWMPLDHKIFYDNLKIHFYDRDNDLFFVHGGIDDSAVEVDLKNQAEDTLLWMRTQVDYRNIGDVRVVHGHTPKFSVEILPHRINIDTACVFGGRLTAAIFKTEYDGYETIKFVEVDGLQSRKGRIDDK
jgi:serine/threonine protein phosphatase 1